MERRNTEENHQHQDFSGLLPTTNNRFPTTGMAANHHHHYFPSSYQHHHLRQPQLFLDLDRSPTLTPSPTITPTSLLDLESSFSRFNLSNTTNHSTPSYQSSYLPTPLPPPSRPPVAATLQTPLLDSSNPMLLYDHATLLRELYAKNIIIQSLLEQHAYRTNPPTSLYTNGFGGLGANSLKRGGGGGGGGYNNNNNNNSYDETTTTRSAAMSRRGSLGSMDLALTSQFNMMQLECMKLEELRGMMVNMAKDQNGCRYLQKKIEEGREEDIKIIFFDVRNSLSELMVDQFGNYLVQKMLDVCSEEQRTEILFAVTKSDYVLLTICKDAHGTRAMQKLLEHLSTSQQIFQIIKALLPITVPLTTDLNGHHVIQHCVKHFDNEDTKYLLDAVATNCVKIARDRSGCCVLQLCVEHAHGELKECLVAEITRNALLLADDPYGNYVVQHILGMKMPNATAKLLKKFEGEFLHLSTQKFSSNVVERCLKESTKEQAMQIIKELVDGKDILPLLQDMFGNYVIQTALTVCVKTPIFNSVVERIGMHYSSLRSHPFGKRIIQKIDSLTNKQYV